MIDTRTYLELINTIESANLVTGDRVAALDQPRQIVQSIVDSASKLQFERKQLPYTSTFKLLQQYIPFAAVAASAGQISTAEQVCLEALEVYLLCSRSRVYHTQIVQLLMSIGRLNFANGDQAAALSNLKAALDLSMGHSVALQGKSGRLYEIRVSAGLSSTDIEKVHRRVFSVIAHEFILRQQFVNLSDVLNDLIADRARIISQTSYIIEELRARILIGIGSYDEGLSVLRTIYESNGTHNPDAAVLLVPISQAYRQTNMRANGITALRELDRLMSQFPLLPPGQDFYWPYVSALEQSLLADYEAAWANALLAYRATGCAPDSLNCLKSLNLLLHLSLVAPDLQATEDGYTLWATRLEEALSLNEVSLDSTISSALLGDTRRHRSATTEDSGLNICYLRRAIIGIDRLFTHHSLKPHLTLLQKLVTEALSICGDSGTHALGNKPSTGEEDIYTAIENARMMLTEISTEAMASVIAHSE